MQIKIFFAARASFFAAPATLAVAFDFTSDC
jgi:hypothetical protein